MGRVSLAKEDTIPNGSKKRRADNKRSTGAKAFGDNGDANSENEGKGIRWNSEQLGVGGSVAKTFDNRGLTGGQCY